MSSLMFGDVAVEIKSEHPAGKIFAAEFSLLETSDARGDFLLHVGDYSAMPDTDGARVCDDMYLTDAGLMVDRRTRGRFGDLEFAYLMHGHPWEADRFSVDVFCDPRYATGNGSLARLRRLRDWNYLYPVERIAKNLSYNLLEPYLNVFMLSRGQTFIHASGVEKDGKAYVFTGWGGTGKTAATLKLVLDHDMRFLADDLLIINRKGMAFLYPKKLQVYGYNIEGFPELRARLMAGRSAMDRTHWALFRTMKGPKRVRRRVSPLELLGKESIGHTRTSIDTVMFLEPKVGGSIRFVEIEAWELAARSRAVITKELWSGYRYLNAYESLAVPEKGLAEILLENQELYHEIFSRLEIVKVEVPRGTHPDVLASAVKERI